MKLLELKLRRNMLIFRYPHMKVLLLIILFMTACSQKINLQQSTGASSSTYTGMYLQAKPLSELPDSSEEALVALTFSKALTFAEAQDAMEGMNLKVRSIYYTNGIVSGTMGEPQAISAHEAFLKVQNLFKDAAFQDRERLTNDIQTFRESSLFNIISQDVAIDNPANRNSELAIQLLSNSSELREAAQLLTVQYRLIRYFEESVNNTKGVVVGIQVQGSLQDIKTYARKLPTVGYTDEYHELYSSLRPKLPAEIQSIMAQQATMDTSAEKLYADVIEATTYLGISWGE